MTNETQKPKHTPEPWEEYAQDINGKVDECYRTIQAGRGYLDISKGNHSDTGFSITGYIKKQDAARIVACVHAMKDVTDPQQFMDDILVRLQNEIEQNAQLKEQAKQLVWNNEALLNQFTEAVVRINDLEAECGRSELIFDVKTSVDVEKLAESQRKLYEKLTGEQNVNDNSKQSHPTRTPNAPKHFLILNTEHNTLYSENNDGYATPYPTYDKAVDVAQQFVNAPFQIIPVNS